MKIHPAWDISHIEKKKQNRKRERVAFWIFLMLGILLGAVVFMISFRPPEELPPITAAPGNEEAAVMYENLRTIVSVTRAFIAGVMASASVLLIAPNWMELKEWHRYALAGLTIALVLLGMVQ